MATLRARPYRAVIHLRSRVLVRRGADRGYVAQNTRRRKPSPRMRTVGASGTVSCRKADFSSMHRWLVAGWPWLLDRKGATGTVTDRTRARGLWAEPRSARRSAEIEHRYDPDNLFRINQNISPA